MNFSLIQENSGFRGSWILREFAGNGSTRIIKLAFFGNASFGDVIGRNPSYDMNNFARP
ncbi:hypothetical protein [Helicobacter mustelae]|uniref:hypothetical protein n=1 Tax=Helicobacter mustelae TaxID=217 RepID=UPI0013051F8B|nr:hypothetical protein [Helicobacter mustelae]